LESLLQALAVEVDPPTAVSDPARARAVHVADSLVAAGLPELREATAVADIGSGAGFPGLPLALALPEARVDLIDSSKRSCAVIDRLIAAAGIQNARSLPYRVEEWGAGEGRESYGAVTARALASLAVLVEYAAPLLEPGGVLIAWKGKRREDEEVVGDAASETVGLSAASVREVQPFPEARDRHLYVFEKIAPTPDRFPRRPGMAAKRPLG